MDMLLTLYCTTDRDNARVAAIRGRKAGLTIRHLEPRDGPPPASTALIIDADLYAFTEEERARLVKELVTLVAAAPVAVHGYGLSDSSRKELRRAGVLVFRRADHQLFAALAERAARQARTTGV